MSPGITTGVGGASLDWDRRRRVTPVQTASQEAWPEADLGDEILSETRAAVERRQACALQKGARRIARCGGATQRLPAFRFLQFCRVVLSEAKPTRLGREESTAWARRSAPLPTLQMTKPAKAKTKARPHPCPSLDRTGFAIDVTIFLQACDPFAIVRTTERGRKNAPRDGRVWP